MYLNKVLLIGTAVRNAKISSSETGDTIAKFTLAVQRKVRKSEKPKADFIDCVAFGWQAEFAERFVKQGKHFFVEGRLNIDSYTGKNGVKQWFTKIIVTDISFAGKKEDDDSDVQKDYQETIPQKTNEQTAPSAQDCDSTERQYNIGEYFDATGTTSAYGSHSMSSVPNAPFTYTNDEHGGACQATAGSSGATGYNTPAVNPATPGISAPAAETSLGPSGGYAPAPVYAPEYAATPGRYPEYEQAAYSGVSAFPGMTMESPIPETDGFRNIPELMDDDLPFN